MRSAPLVENKLLMQSVFCAMNRSQEEGRGVSEGEGGYMSGPRWFSPEEVEIRMEDSTRCQGEDYQGEDKEVLLDLCLQEGREMETDCPVL